MAAPTLVLSETNTAAATVTDNVPTVAFASVDAASTNTLSGLNAVAVGNNSFEKYERFKVTGVAPNNISAMGIAYSATAATDSGGSSSTVAAKYAANVSYATPVATTSTVATNAVTGDTGTPGTSLTAPANTVGSYSAYFCMQFQSTSGAAGGNAIFPSPFVTGNYTWS
jgi:hypothetical protein